MNKRKRAHGFRLVVFCNGGVLVDLPIHNKITIRKSKDYVYGIWVNKVFGT